MAFPPISGLILKAALYAAVFVLLAALLLRALENRLIYFPDREDFFTPKVLSQPFEEAAFTAADGVRLRAWWIGDPKRPLTILFFNGNAGNMSHRLDRIQTLLELPARFFLFDYRGYGASDGKPSEAGLYRDARAAYGFLRERGVSPGDIVLFGESLGAAVAIDLAAVEPVRALVLENPFTSVRDMARRVFPFVPRFLVPDRYNSIGKIGKVSVPVFVAGAARDEIVPPEMGRRLFEAVPGPKRFFSIPGARHNDAYVVGGKAYRDALAEFLALPR